MDPFLFHDQESDETELQLTGDSNKGEKEMITDSMRTQSTRMSQSSIQRYTSSPSARQKHMKQLDCRFCDANIPPSYLIDHLKKKTNEKCRFLYLKNFRVPCLESLVSKIFSCEMCYEKKRINFQMHLEKKQECLRKYQLKFGLKDIKKIDEKVKAAKRKSFPSRSSETLKLKYEATRDSKTLYNSLNEYRENVAFGNIRLCIHCRANYRLYGAKEVRKKDELFERFNLSLQENQLLRRFETFFICNSCAKDEERSDEDEEVNSTLDSFTENEDVIFFPPRVAKNEPCMPVHQKNVKLWFPNTSEAVEHLDSQKSQKNKKKVLRNLFKTQAVQNSSICDLYKLECEKYKKVKEGGVLFSGIIDFQTKKVTNLRSLASCAKISSSKDWFKANTSRMKERQVQFGLIHCFAKIYLEKNSRDVLATALIQADTPVTLEKRGLGNGEMEICYKVHTDHKSDKNCSTNCKNKSNIEDFVRDTGFHIEEASNAFTNTYVSSCHQKLVSFANSIIQAPASSLCSQDYQLHLTFDKDGMASIVGSFWPDALSGINDNIAENDGDIVDEEELLQFVEKNISCTGDPRLIRSKFSLSEEEANKLSELVLTHQVHMECEEAETCEICSSLPLPSMENLLKQETCENNYRACKELISLVQLRLKTLTLEQKKRMKTWTFLEDLWELVGGEAKKDNEVLTFTIATEDMELKFVLDSRLNKYLGKYEDSIKTGVYQYALSCCGDFSGTDFIVLQRLWLVDCHILPYNPLHLKSTKATTIIKIVNDTKLFENNLLPKNEVEKLDERMDPLVPLSHRLISLAEAIAISDPQIKMVQSSSKEQFVNAKENREVLLKKVTNPEEGDYQDVGSADKFTLVVDPISRHFNRQNTSDGLLLIETSAWYDYAGKEKSRELFDAYKNFEIPKSEEPTVCSNENLPELILCKNGDVLMKRKKKKVIIVPTPTTERDMKYAKSLLFLPIRSEMELIGTGVLDRFNDVNLEKHALVVEHNERKFYAKKIMKMTKVDPLDELLFALDTLLDASDGENDDEEV